MPPDVLIAETVAAPAPAVPAAPVQDYSDYVNTFTSEERLKWAQTGEEPKDKPFTPATPEKEPEKPVSQEPEPVKAKVEPDAGTGDDDDDDEPVFVGTPEEIKRARRAFTRLRRENAELKAERKLLREQKAEKPEPAPAAAATHEPEIELSEPEMPNIADYDDVAKYHADMKQFNKDVRAYDQALLKKQIETEHRTQAAEAARLDHAAKWADEIKDAKKAHEDFEKIAFNPKVPASLPMLGVIMGMTGGAEVFYRLGLDPGFATELTEATDIPGNFKSYEELQAAADKDARLARRLGAAEGIVRAEVKRLMAGTKKPDAPKPITTTKAAIPGARVSATSTAAGDPVEDAYARGDFAEGARLESARDVERHKRR